MNCLQLGRKSGQVLVTGGNDATVNMWAVGKTEPIIVRSSNGACCPVLYCSQLRLGRVTESEGSPECGRVRRVRLERGGGGRRRRSWDFKAVGPGEHKG